MPKQIKPKAKPRKKLTKSQREKLEVVLAWYNFAWTMEQDRHRDSQKKLGNKATEMIEEIIL
jgi:hypothetical protein